MKKFNYYKYLRALGIEEDIAISMTEQATNRRWVECNSATDAISTFMPWKFSEEGWDFWMEKFECYQKLEESE